MKNTLTPQEYFNEIKLLRIPEEIKELCVPLTSGLLNETDKPKIQILENP